MTEKTRTLNRAALVVCLVLFAADVSAEQVSLRDYVENRIDEQDRRIEQRANGEKEARELLSESLTQRLNLLFDAQKQYDAANYATRTALADQKVDIASLQKSQDIAYGAIAALMFLLGLPLIYLIFKRH